MTDLKDRLPELRGKNLGCFCLQTQPCHVRVLQELVDQEVLEPDLNYGVPGDPWIVPKKPVSKK